INLASYAAIENVTLTGAAAANITGNALANLLGGQSAANRLEGMEGEDTLDGGKGADTMVGGTGNDTYMVDNANDLITEVVGGGTDTVFATVTFGLASFGQVENLVLLGTAARGTGNALDNVITGTSGANTLSGGAG